MDREFVYGCLGGLVGQGLCYPFDTVKTRIQADTTYRLFHDLKTNGSLTLYRGLPSPLVSVVLEKSILFSSYHLIKHNQYYSLSSFSSGIAAGLLTTFTVTPFERIKTRAQVGNQGTILALREVLKTGGPQSLYRGWSATLFREVPGYGLYFMAYERSKQYFGEKYTPMTSFLTGSISGLTAWIVIYPSDPVKTIMQNQDIGVKKACQQIYQQSGWKGFYRGYLWGLTRATILHGGVFLGYETAKYLFSPQKARR